MLLYLYQVCPQPKLMFTVYTISMLLSQFSFNCFYFCHFIRKFVIARGFSMFSAFTFVLCIRRVCSFLCSLIRGIAPQQDLYFTTMNIHGTYLQDLLYWLTSVACPWHHALALCSQNSPVIPFPDKLHQ